MNTARFLKYVWSFFNIMHKIVNLFVKTIAAFQQYYFFYEALTLETFY